MPCRIGMTTDKDRRKQEWKIKHPSLKNWKILSTHKSKAEAQKDETFLAKKYKCVSSSGGDGAKNTTWYVYKFEY